MDSDTITGRMTGAIALAIGKKVPPKVTRPLESVMRPRVYGLILTTHRTLERLGADPSGVIATKARPDGHNTEGND